MNTLTIQPSAGHGSDLSGLRRVATMTTVLVLGGAAHAMRWAAMLGL
jgi:hypothetical protein